MLEMVPESRRAGICWRRRKILNVCCVPVTVLGTPYIVKTFFCDLYNKSTEKLEICTPQFTDEKMEWTHKAN